MTRILLAGVAGAFIYFLWGMAAWMIIPLHAPTMHGLPQENSVREALREQDLQTGVYAIPWSDQEAEWQEADSQLNQNHREGPLVTIFYQREGAELMPMGMFIVGLLIDLLACMLAACLLSATLGSNPSYASRVGFVLGLGIFVALVAHVGYWNWLRFPTDYTIAFVIDVIVGWTLAGSAIAAIVRPEATNETSESAPDPPTAVTKVDPKPVAPARSLRNDAITLLATLQREARLVDIVKEPLTDYSDAQVGAAARDVLRDCGAVLDRLFDLQAVVDQQEGTTVEVPAGFDPGRYRVTGDTATAAPYTGSLIHPGWAAQRCNLPQWTGSEDSAMIVAPAEVEVR